jgi:hypothetical protein
MQRYAEAQDLTVVPNGFYQRDAFFDVKFTAGIAKSKETLAPCSIIRISFQHSFSHLPLLSQPTVL